MSWSMYLVDKENKLILCAGKVNKDNILEDFELYKKIKEQLEKISQEEDLNEIKLNKLTIGILTKLINAYNLLQQLSWIQTNWSVLEYMLKNEDKIHEFEYVYELNNNYKNYIKL